MYVLLFWKVDPVLFLGHGGYGKMREDLQISMFFHILPDSPYLDEGILCLIFKTSNLD